MMSVFVAGLPFHPFTSAVVISTMIICIRMTVVLLKPTAEILFIPKAEVQNQ